MTVTRLQRERIVRIPRFTGFNSVRESAAA
jgi:hypothetical protein